MSGKRCTVQTVVRLPTDAEVGARYDANRRRAESTGARGGVGPMLAEHRAMGARIAMLELVIERLIGESATVPDGPQAGTDSPSVEPVAEPGDRSQPQTFTVSQCEVAVSEAADHTGIGRSRVKFDWDAPSGTLRVKLSGRPGVSTCMYLEGQISERVPETVCVVVESAS